MPSILDYAAEDRSAALRPQTFAMPDETLSYGERLAKIAPLINPVAALTQTIGKDIVERPGEFADLFGAAERQTRLVDITFSRDAAREEAYDRRIKAVRDATGITLENPERGGYSLSERDLRRLSAEGPIDPGAYRRQQFEAALGRAREAHPDKTDALTFGDVDQEAAAIAKTAAGDFERVSKETGLSTPSALVTEFGAGLWGRRRDPLTVGSLFAGPTGAVGRTVAARILSSSLMQGLYNVGLTALEQPAVQAWRSELGLRSGVQPALENVGLAFLFGAIPGTALRGLHEIGAAARPAVQRVLDGGTVEGDIEKTLPALRGILGEIEQDSTAMRAIRLGEGEDAAAAATATRPAKNVAPELHDDLAVAAQRYGDDPINQPSPAAVDVLHNPERLPPEVADRIEQARPETQREAQMAASEALEDIGNREANARTRVALDQDRLPAPAPLPEGAKPPPASSKDPLNRIALADEDGNPKLVSARQIARQGEREMQFADLIRECK